MRTGPLTYSLRHALVLVIVLAAIIFAWSTGLFQLGDIDRLRVAVRLLRGAPYLPLAFILSYTLLSAIGVPASPLTLAGGALFGTSHGIVFNWIGAFAGATLSFALVRTLAGGLAFRGSLQRGELVGRLLGPGAPMLLFRLRLIPAVPFSLLNAGAAMSTMSWRSYAVATGLGIVPVTVVYTTFAASLLDGIAGSGRRAIGVAMASALTIIALTFLARRPQAATGHHGKARWLS